MELSDSDVIRIATEVVRMQEMRQTIKSTRELIMELAMSRAATNDEVEMMKKNLSNQVAAYEKRYGVKP
jgi:hypothetical protein